MQEYVNSVRSLNYLGQPLKEGRGDRLEIDNTYAGKIIVRDAENYVFVWVIIKFDPRGERALLLIANIAKRDHANVWEVCQNILDNIAIRDFSGFVDPCPGWKYLSKSLCKNVSITDWLEINGETRTAQQYAEKAYELRDAILRESCLKM